MQKTSAAFEYIKRSIILCFSFFVLILSGCTTFEMPDTTALVSRGLPPTHTIKNVPVIKQKDHYCGPAALATVAQYNGRTLSQDSASELVYTPGRKGTLQHDIVSGMQRQGLLAVPVNTTQDLLTEISDNHPVIIFQNLGLSWVPTWHYSVISGYDLTSKKLLVHGGAANAKWKDLSTIGKTWKRAGYWGYVATLPDTLPTTANEEELLQAIAALETAGKLAEARLAYKALLLERPESYKAYLGLGNIAMEEKLYRRAEQHYRKALKINSDYVYAINNLAYSLNEQGRKQESCDLLKRHSTLNHRDIINSYAEICQ